MGNSFEPDQNGSRSTTSSATDSVAAAPNTRHQDPSRSSRTRSGKTNEMRISYTNDQTTGLYVPLAKVPTSRT